MTNAESNTHPIQAALAKAIALACVRNTFLEDMHAGKVPKTQTGDYSDVKVVTPFGDIAWNDLSRIDDDEMQRLMKEVVNKIFTVLVRLDDPAFLKTFDEFTAQSVKKWDDPEFLEKFIVRTAKD
jgi:hypothetical protein